jgi:hypothetical protein
MPFAITFTRIISNRREWIRSLTGGKVQPILDQFPCFEYGKYVSKFKYPFWILEVKWLEDFLMLYYLIWKDMW